jgi:enoyl-CoA hydratase
MKIGNRNASEGEVKYGTIICAKEDAIGVVTLNRPESLNALSTQLKEELSVAFDEMAQDAEVKGVLVTGAGNAFCAGADIKERSKMQVTSPEFYFSQKKTTALFEKIAEFPKPVVAAVNGAAVGGGCELCLACDLRVASEKAKFGLPEVKIGVIPAGGGTQRLPRLIGVARAKELLLTGDLIDAQEAYRLGLVNRVVPADRLMEDARGLVGRIANNPPLSVRFIKRAVNVGMQLDIHSAVDYETQCAAVLIETEDRIEGFKAFVEKRKPRFRGR